jgi:hypothetical protein
MCELGLIPSMPLEAVNSDSCWWSTAVQAAGLVALDVPKIVEMLRPVTKIMARLINTSSKPILFATASRAHIRAANTKNVIASATIRTIGASQPLSSGLVWFGAGQLSSTSAGG